MSAAPVCATDIGADLPRQTWTRHGRLCATDMQAKHSKTRGKEERRPTAGGVINVVAFVHVRPTIFSAAGPRGLLPSLDLKRLSRPSRPSAHSRSHTTHTQAYTHTHPNHTHINNSRTNTLTRKHLSTCGIRKARPWRGQCCDLPGGARHIRRRAS